VERNEWRRRCEAAERLPGFTAWGALVGSTLAASVVTFEMGDWVYMLYQQCLRQYLPQHVNNALGFAVTMEVLARPGVRSILYGLHSLDAPPSVDEFKFRMGYLAKPVRQRVVLARGFGWVASRPCHGLVRGSLRLFPGNSMLAKTEGMIRFFRSGMLPLAAQPVPAPFAGAHCEDPVETHASGEDA
jgi:hypothetical protein